MVFSLMLQKVIVEAYPTIPIIFLGGINPDRSPLYDTMGLAVTSVKKKTKTITSIKRQNCEREKPEIDFYLNGKQLSGKRGSQIIEAIRYFMKQNQVESDLAIYSENYNIYSGSSDSGLAALFTGLNTIFDLQLSQDDLLTYAMKGSESAGRSLYGGLTLTKATDPIKVKQLASEKELEDLSLFSVPFDFPSRISADEIHAGIVTHPNFQERVDKIPQWVQDIKAALSSHNLLNLLETAETNIRNAHKLLEEVGLTIRKKEMMELCDNVHTMRTNGLPAYFLIGGGNLITIATIKKFENRVSNFLIEHDWSFKNFKVAGPPQIIEEKN